MRRCRKRLFGLYPGWPDATYAGARSGAASETLALFVGQAMLVIWPYLAVRVGRTAVSSKRCESPNAASHPTFVDHLLDRRSPYSNGRNPIISLLTMNMYLESISAVHSRLIVLIVPLTKYQSKAYPASYSTFRKYYTHVNASQKIAEAWRKAGYPCHSAPDVSRPLLHCSHSPRQPPYPPLLESSQSPRQVVVQSCLTGKGFALLSNHFSRSKLWGLYSARYNFASISPIHGVLTALYYPPYLLLYIDRCDRGTNRCRNVRRAERLY